MNCMLYVCTVHFLVPFTKVCFAAYCVYMKAQKIWEVIHTEHSRDPVYYIIGRERERFSQLPLVYPFQWKSHIAHTLSLSITHAETHTSTHTHTQAQHKDRTHSNLSGEYPLCYKKGGNDWCTYELKFNWRTWLPVMAAIHQLGCVTPPFQTHKKVKTEFPSLQV